jgi:hypothetical protein
LVDLQKLQTTLNLTEEEEKMAMEHMIPMSKIMITQSRGNKLPTARHIAP